MFTTVPRSTTVFMRRGRQLPLAFGGRWARGLPLSSGGVMLLLTERCNSRCVHCDIWKNRGKEDSSHAGAVGGALADSAAGSDRSTSDHRGRGAPRALHARRRAPRVRLGLLMEDLTHGYWNDQTRIEGLARANPGGSRFPSTGSARSTRGSADGSILRGNVDSIQTLLRLRESEAGYSVLLKTVIMRHNLPRSAPIARFAGPAASRSSTSPSSRTTTRARTRAGSSTARTGRRTRSGRSRPCRSSSR